MPSNARSSHVTRRAIIAQLSFSARHQRLAGERNTGDKSADKDRTILSFSQIKDPPRNGVSDRSTSLVRPWNLRRAYELRRKRDANFCQSAERSTRINAVVAAGPRKVAENGLSGGHLRVKFRLRR